VPPELAKVNLNAAGIDIGATQHYVAIPEGRDEVTVRCFGTFTADLEGLADWLIRCGIKTVAMESTGVYWIPVFEILEARGLEVKLVEPSKIKNAPGRKTDVLDCQWIQQLHLYGLLEGSFRPVEQINILRSYMRQRDRMVKQAADHIRHMQKALMQMNVQLHHVISDITGLTGMRIIDAILAGQRDPHELAKLRDHRCKKDAATIALALQGHWREDHLFELQQAVEMYRVCQQKLLALDERIEAHLKTFSDKSEGKVLKPRPRQRKFSSTEPTFDMRNLLYRLAGVDLTEIDGIGGHLALGLIAELGIDMRPWPTEKRFASWLTLCPGNHKTGGRVSRNKTRTRQSANRAAALLRQAAWSLERADCALGAYYRRMKARLGAPKAITATAHRLARIVYNLLKYGKKYTDQGAEAYEAQYRQRSIENLRRRAKQYGFTLAPDAAA
jgi:transposase